MIALAIIYAAGAIWYVLDFIEFVRSPEFPEGRHAKTDELVLTGVLVGLIWPIPFTLQVMVFLDGLGRR